MTPKTLTCVLVDDEQSNLDVLVNYVNQIPYLVLKATFVKPLEALAYLLKTPTDLLITDISMPRLSGIELCESIYNEGSIQTIFISGHPDKMMEAMQNCVTDYLAKPVSIVRFEKATQKALFFSNLNKQRFEEITSEILETALKNYYALSETEKKILKLIAEGNSTPKIADIVFISKRTVESHRHTIRQKLKLLPDNSLTQIAKYIVESIK